MNLFPQPREREILPGSTAKPDLRVKLQPEQSQRFREASKSIGFQISDTAKIQVFVNREIAQPGGYEIHVSKDSIFLTAFDEAAAFHGMITLTQVLAQCDDQLPCLRIVDWPDLPVRGFMLDISRCKVPTLESVYQLIDHLAALKYDQLQLYTEHTFAYANHELVWKDASPYTAEEIRSIDTYCHFRYIELVPNQNSFGHMERWLRHPSYRHLAECPNGFEHPLAGWKRFGSTLKPTLESLDFVESLFRELLPNFRSAQCNVGGDEPWELGQGWSRELTKKRGKRRVYLDHLLAIRERVAALGHRMQFWGDIVLEEPELARELPRDVTGLLWGYEASHPFAEQCAAFAAAGVPFYVVPGTSTWNSIGGRLHTALPNIHSAVRNAIEHGAAGILLTEWGDNGHHQPDSLKLPLIAYAAGLAWNFADNQNLDTARSATVRLLDLDTSQVDAIWRLGMIASRFSKPIHNASWLNRILFATAEQLASILPNVELGELAQCQSELSELSDIAPIDLVNRQLAVSRDLLLFACDKAIAAKENRSLPDIATTDLIDRFQKTWLERNRPGGLPESAASLQIPNTHS